MPLRYLDAVVGDDCHIEGTECTRHQDCSLLEEKSLRCVEKDIRDVRRSGGSRLTMPLVQL